MATDNPRASIALPVYSPVLLAGSSPSGALPRPFQMLDASDDDDAKFRVIISTLGGDRPDGFSPGDDPPYILDASDGDTLYACVTGDTTSTANPLPINSRTLGVGSSVPDDDPTDATFYYRIGTIAVADGVPTLTNLAYGPIDVVIYRNWYTFPIVWGVAWHGNY